MSDEAAIRDQVLRLIGWATQELSATTGVMEDVAPGRACEDPGMYEYCKGQVQTHTQWLKAMTDVARDLVHLVGDDGPFT